VNVTITLEQRFELSPDGGVWTPGQGSYQFLQRYLDVFGQVSVVARVQRVAQITPGWKRADGERVSFIPVPYYLGPWQYLRRALEIRRLLQSVAQFSEAAILRAPSIISTGLIKAFAERGHPYALEILGDPWDAFAPGVIRHPLRAYFRLRFSQDLQRQCKGSCATAYVTKEALQCRYPSPPDALSTSYSDVELADESFSSTAKRCCLNGPIKLVMVGSLAQLYKGPDVLIDAVGMCVKQGLNLQLVLVGDGNYRPYLMDKAARLGLSERVQFTGQLAPGKPVRAEMDKADLFILPSRTEGLPRAMIEAMALALPCIGSNVGGIPELLYQDDLVPSGDAIALAKKITELSKDPERLTAMSRRNLAHARQYHESHLSHARTTFYEYVRARTGDWLTAHSTHNSQRAA
jgi:glycosyltransferase involved in cell wall biosynthesis